MWGCAEAARTSTDDDDAVGITGQHSERPDDNEEGRAHSYSSWICGVAGVSSTALGAASTMVVIWRSGWWERKVAEEERVAGGGEVVWGARGNSFRSRFTILPASGQADLYPVAAARGGVQRATFGSLSV